MSASTRHWAAGSSFREKVERRDYIIPIILAGIALSWQLDVPVLRPSGREGRVKPKYLGHYFPREGPSLTRAQGRRGFLPCQDQRWLGKLAGLPLGGFSCL